MQGASGPGALGTGLANGIQSGLLSMNQGAQDHEDRRYREAIMGRMTANSEREQRLFDLKDRIRNPDGSINAEAFKAWQVEDPKGAKEWYEAINPTRRNPGQPVYIRNGDYEDPYVWDDQQGAYVPAGQFVGGQGGLLGDAVQQATPPMFGIMQPPTSTSVDPVNDFGSLIGGFPGVQVSSLYRDPSHNAKVGGVANSYHTRGQGMDAVVPPEYRGAFRSKASSMGYDAIDEGDHIHVEPARGMTASSAFGPNQQVGAPPAQVFGRRPVKTTQQEAYRTLTADEVAQQGLPVGTVAQIGPNGKIDVVNKPDARPGTPGVLPLSAGEAAKVRTQFKETKDALNTFKAFDRALTEVPNGAGLLLEGEQKGRLGTAYNNARAALRIVYNTGVLQPGELPMLESALRDPTSFQAVLDPRTRPQIQAQLDELYRALATNIDNQVQSYPQIFNQDVYQQRKQAGGNNGPALGEVQDGHRFKGGDPADPNSWERL